MYSFILQPLSVIFYINLKQISQYDLLELINNFQNSIRIIHEISSIFISIEIIKIINNNLILSILSALPDEMIFKYIIFYSQNRQTGISAYLNRQYFINNLKIDVKRNIEVLFTIDDVEFERMWATFHLFLQIVIYFSLGIFFTPQIIKQPLHIKVVTKSFFLYLDNIRKYLKK